MDLFLAAPEQALGDLVGDDDPVCVSARASFADVVEALVEARARRWWWWTRAVGRWVASWPTTWSTP